MPSDLDQLQNRIGYQFRDIKLLYIALTHSSCQIQLLETNRRFEFLGDRVLSLIVAEELIKRHRIFAEGALSTIHASIICNPSLAKHANAISLGQHLTIYEKAPHLRTLESSLSDAFEALVAAIYLDGGLDAARGFVLRELQADFDTPIEKIRTDNPKSDLQEYLQERSRLIPTYTVISSSGPDNDRTFICAAMCGDTELARGNGRSKQQAEANAARKALEDLKAKRPL